MNKQLKENISALVDNQWDDASVIKSLAGDSDARQTWQRYHLIRDAMQGELSSPLDEGFAARVSDALKDEPPIVAFPASENSADESNGSDGSDRVGSGQAGAGQAPRGASVTPFRFRRNLVGLSVAASVALVSVVGLNLWQQQSNPTEVPDVAVADPVAPVEGGLQFVSNRSGSYWVNQQQRNISPEMETRLNMFLSEHIENSPTGDVRGMLPYSRLAGYDTGSARR